jgi:hypothetical protein
MRLVDSASLLVYLCLGYIGLTGKSDSVQWLWDLCFGGPGAAAPYAPPQVRP